MRYRTDAEINPVTKSIVHISFLLFLTLPVLSQSTPMVPPEEVGLSTDRLKRLEKLIERYVREQKIAGGVSLIARDGNIAHVGTHGLMDVEAGTPMLPDTIFRIASMTKPITSVAVMMLYEEGHFQLKDPISKFIPTFKEMHVLPAADAEALAQPVPAERQITIWNLLTHTSGLSYHWNPRIGAQYAEAGIPHGLLQAASSLDEKMNVLATLPLLNQPGSAFEYGLSTDVLGSLVEVVSGMSLDAFFSERIFKPLGMEDTHFYLPRSKRNRIATVYESTPEGVIQRKSKEPTVLGSFVYSDDYCYEGPQTYFSGGAGLVSTAFDYFRFAQMLLNGGELDGVRLLSRKTVALMTLNHLGEMDLDFGLGLGFSVLRDVRDLTEIGSVGTFAGGGFFSTDFFIDPQERMIGIFMCQLPLHGGLELIERIRILNYQAIVD